MIQCQMRCADGIGREPTVGCRINPHTLTQPKTTDRKSARELFVSKRENKRTSSNRKLLKLYMEVI